jgi:hypothetical protein
LAKTLFGFEGASLSLHTENYTEENLFFEKREQL